jgi:formate dehydrogenase subunit gamma
MRTEYGREAANAIIASFGARPEMLVQILHAFMERFGWIPEEAAHQLAEDLNLSRAEVHGTISYYHDFRTAPPGRRVVRICQAEACQAMGSRELTAHAQATLGVGINASTAEYSLEPVYCLGNCACSPAVMVDGKTYGRVDGRRFDAIIAATREAD